uniref:Uncharacterized protein n=1 Tax=Candidatus Kentrum sp. TC TaxID=2126339 RepID=A0A450ZAB2_9GAMM|nr:MAG: hypothetical protein BECKTC1821D_GA0114238_11188 [Candidatus Kentron sp. TC]
MHEMAQVEFDDSMTDRGAHLYVFQNVRQSNQVLPDHEDAGLLSARRRRPIADPRLLLPTAQCAFINPQNLTGIFPSSMASSSSSSAIRRASGRIILPLRSPRWPGLFPVPVALPLPPAPSPYALAPFATHSVSFSLSAIHIGEGRALIFYSALPRISGFRHPHWKRYTL